MTVRIRVIPCLDVRDGRVVKGVTARAQGRLADLESRMAEMQRIHRGLKALIDACPGRGPLKTCPILAALTAEERS